MTKLQLITSIEPNLDSNVLRLLLVDDDEIMRLYVSSALRKAGMVVFEAKSGEEALAGQHNVDLVLMDVRMPGMDGFTACSQLKEQPAMAGTPVVMLTGLEDKHSISKATEVGAVDYITKPLNLAVLIKRLHHIVQAQRNYQELEVQKCRQKALLEAIPDIVMQFDSKGVLIEANFPVPSERLQLRATPGSDIREIFYGIAPFDPMILLRNTLTGTTDPIQIGWPGKQEKSYDVRFVNDGNDNILCILRDTTTQIKQQRDIQTLSLKDHITGLPNRAWFLQVIQRYINSAPSESISILKLSIDEFNKIENSFGLKFAERIITEARNTIVKAVELDDIDYHYRSETLPFLARTGTNEFHIFSHETRTNGDLKDLANRVKIAFDKAIAIDSYEVKLKLTCGIASEKCNLTSAHEIFNKCGLATEVAYKNGATQPVAYSEEIQAALMRPIVLETELRKAIEQGDIEIVYQPKVCAKTRAIIGTEALSRWHHPDHGFISPAEFIPLAEETGLIMALGEYVLHTACKQLQNWQQTPLDGVSIAVNVSSHQLNQESAAQRLLEIIQLYDVDPALLELEITESVIADQKHIIPILQTWRSCGIKIALDDFGTGYSSLSMLGEFPINTLKIDRSFINPIDDLKASYSIIDAIIALGHALNLRLVAEGVETETQLHYMQQRDCHLIQGYLTGKPMKPSQIMDLQSTDLTAINA